MVNGRASVCPYTIFHLQFTLLMAQANKALSKKNSRKTAAANRADTRDVVGSFPLSTREDVHAAVDAARDAFDRWRRTPAPRRAEILFRLGEILIRNKEAYASDMTRE